MHEVSCRQTYRFRGRTRRLPHAAERFIVHGSRPQVVRRHGAISPNREQAELVRQSTNKSGGAERL